MILLVALPATVRCSLVAGGLSYLVEHAGNFVVQAVAGAAAEQARKC